MFSAKVFNALCQFIACRSDLEFIDMYIAIGLQQKDIQPVYAIEKFNMARTDFISWWTNVDTPHQDSILNYIKDFYHIN